MQYEIKVTHEPSAECQREIVRALTEMANGGGTLSGSTRWLPLETELDEKQWDRCWWNTRWWARNEDAVGYALFRASGRGCPVFLEGGHARIELDIDYPDLARSALVEEEASGGLREHPEEPLEYAYRVIPEDQEDLRVRAIRFVQNGRVFFESVMRAEDVIARSVVDVWRADASDDEAGYQRAPMARRLREVAQYLDREDAIMPIGGLLNARAEQKGSYGQVLGFEADPGQEGSIQSGTLIIPRDALPLYIVDMQHRLGGFKFGIEEGGQPELADFPVVATIADGLSKIEEVDQFNLINTEQRKVRTDLARRLMAIQTQDLDRRLEFDRKGKLWEARGPIVADRLNRDANSVWFGRIMPPNSTKRDLPDAIMRETSFVTSLKTTLQMPFFQRRTDQAAASIIGNYWKAIAAVFPEPFEHPRGYVIQKTPGVYPLHMSLPDVIELCKTQDAVITAEQFSRVISVWNGLGSEFGASDNEDGAAAAGSMKGFGRTAAELRALLPQIG